MKEFAPNSRKIRLSYSDPDATDSSSDESPPPEGRSKRIVHELVLPKEKVFRRGAKAPEFYTKGYRKDCGFHRIHGFPRRDLGRASHGAEVIRWIGFLTIRIGGIETAESMAPPHSRMR